MFIVFALVFIDIMVMNLIPGMEKFPEVEIRINGFENDELVVMKEGDALEGELELTAKDKAFEHAGVRIEVEGTIKGCFVMRQVFKLLLGLL